MVKRFNNVFKFRIFKLKVLIFCEGLIEKNYFNVMKEDLGLLKIIVVNVF